MAAILSGIVDYNEETGELPLLSAGQKLRESRIAQGLSIDSISAQTKIASRHLKAIEDDRLSDLASRTYAIGFSRAYARALGVNELQIADSVRRQLDAEAGSRPAPTIDNFEPGDPARVPPSVLAWGAGIAFLGVVVALFLFWRSFVDPAGELPDLVSETEKAVEVQPTALPSAVAEVVGPVVVTAVQGGVWVKIVDGAGAQIFQKEMTQGETFTVPSTAQGAVLSTARPNAIGVSVGGKAVTKFGGDAAILRNVSIDAKVLSAQVNGSQQDASSSQPTNTAVSSQQSANRAVPQAQRANSQQNAASVSRGSAVDAPAPLADPARNAVPAAGAADTATE